jgi:hypothetical protein
MKTALLLLICGVSVVGCERKTDQSQATTSELASRNLKPGGQEKDT